MNEKLKNTKSSKFKEAYFYAQKLKATFWSWIYRIYDWVNLKTMGTKSWLLITLYVMVAGFSIAFSFHYNEMLEKQLDSLEVLKNIEGVLSATGQTLLGASAITFSFIVFAMQVNVERMPYGLFRQLSSDVQLLALFVLSVSASIFLASASLMKPIVPPIPMLTIGISILVGILIVFVLAYQRALLLINPIKQLSHLVRSSSRVLVAWGSRANKLTPLLLAKESLFEDTSPFDSDLDHSRLAFFRANNHWKNDAKQGVLYAISIARTYAERGDHQVSAFALSAITAIHAEYVKIRGKTFVVSNPIFNNPLSGDEFLSDTLEHLRQNVRTGITNGNEQQVEHTFQAFVSLVQIYSNADYGNAHGGKFEPSLASSYLSRAVKSAIEMKSPDVLMNGVRCLGISSAAILRSLAQQQDISTLSDIRTIAAVGVASEDYRPVTQSCVGELTDILFSLLLGADEIRKHNIKQVRNDLNLIANFVLEIPNASFTSPHSLCLEPYYSASVPGKFSSRMVEITNQLIDAEETDTTWQGIAFNICSFADQIYQGSKEVLLKSVEKEVAFTFDIVHWISHTSKLLCVISTAPVAKHVSDDLRKHAVWLFSTLTFIPSEKKKIQHVQTWNMLNALFETVLEASYRLKPEDSISFIRVLVNWVFKSGAHDDYQFAEGMLSLIAISATENEALEKIILEEVSKAWKGGKELTEQKKLEVEKILREKIARGLRSEIAVNQSEVYVSKLSDEDLEGYLSNLLDSLSQTE